MTEDCSTSDRILPKHQLSDEQPECILTGTFREKQFPIQEFPLFSERRSTRISLSPLQA
jgi:hypothetical protein